MSDDPIQTYNDSGASVLRIALREEPIHLIVVLEGELDHETSSELEDCLEKLKLRDGQDVLLDLHGLDRTDSTGVAVILEAHQELSKKGHSLRLRGAGDSVRKIFSISLKHAGVLDEDDRPLLRARHLG